MSVTVSVRSEPFDPWRELAAFEPRAASAHGATATFVGTMRDFNEGDAVSEMHLEHYPGMTERQLEAMVERAISDHGLVDALVVHRVGRLLPGDPIVLVATWSAHRAAAFDACRALMEELKSTAPFWKKETLAHGTRWVERNTPG